MVVKGTWDSKPISKPIGRDRTAKRRRRNVHARVIVMGHRVMWVDLIDHERSIGPTHTHTPSPGGGACVGSEAEGINTRGWISLGLAWTTTTTTTTTTMVRYVFDDDVFDDDGIPRLCVVGVATYTSVTRRTRTRHDAHARPSVTPTRAICALDILRGKGRRSNLSRGLPRSSSWLSA